MVSVLLCLSIVLQPLPAGAEPWVLEAEELGVLGRTLDRMGEFQYPYPAVVDIADPDAGAFDASVEVAAAQLGDGSPVILIDDEGIEDVQHFIVLQTPWQGLPAGTLLHKDGDNAAVVTRDDDDPAGRRAQVMMAFLDMMMFFARLEAAE